ncbi:MULTISPECIES: leucine-rich repeat domain-containing protein [Roseomonadaceae]|uniref:Leucine-rich repeat domain-containing protein n=1 Tax=Falsiroseomonas oleicola TaxID=2801474 RepID=A0ABS6H7N4_9PROT|nr:leucine-rich repeat domain-containing protein [Roseomonas oleicola]MBU8544711.1 leucine-rich repeat domain-containing protein [Roseomonas oleicola]
MPLSYGPPDEPLGRELLQVADAARGVIATLATLNVIPPDFPKAALHDLCTALAALPEGTAENCRPQLELARNALPKLRREHFGIEGEGAATTPDDAEQPRFTRGMLLDQRVNVLLAAVTTALDEYRAQAGIAVEDALQPDDVAVPTATARLAGVEAQTEQVVGRLRQGVGQLDARGVSAMEPGDLLRRRLRDSENLALAARSQLRQRSTVARWFEGVSAAFHRTPDLIEAAGRGLSACANAAEPLGRWLVDYLTEWVGTTVRLTRDLGDALQESARRLREASPAPPAPSPSPPELDARDLAELARVGLPVSDDKLRQGGLVIEATAAFSVESFTRADGPWTRVAPRITEARLGSRRDVVDLAPLARLTALQSLDLSGTRVADLAPLANLSALQSLDLRGTRVADLVPLSSLTALQSLDLYSTQVADLAPLYSLTALQSLNLSSTQVADLAPLSSLTALQSLNLWSTKVADLTPLASLTALQSLELSRTEVADLAPLSSLTALQSLELSHTQVADLAPLSSLTALQSLNLSTTKVADLAPLSSLTALQSLNLWSTQVADLAPLASLTALQSLNLWSTQVADLAPLASLTALRSMDLSFTQVADLTPLARLTALLNLDLAFTQVADLAPLASLTALRSMDLQHTQVADLTPLASLTALQRLNLEGTQVGPAARAAFIAARRARGLSPASVRMKAAQP